MKFKTLIYTTAMVFVATLAVGESSSATEGTWHGNKRGTAWVTLNLSRARNGELSGTAVFFILDRDEGQAPARILGKQQVQLVNPRLEGKVFSFEVRNQQDHVVMNPSSGDMLEFQMTLDDENTGTLKSGNSEAPAVKMRKQR